MASSNLFALILLLAPLAMTTTLAKNSNYFSEYIGAEFNGVKFTDVPINSNLNTHFILAFAIDYTTSTNPPSPTNGKFQVYWQNTVLTPAAVASIKKSNPNVKVSVSLGGATVSGDPVYFKINSVSSWVSNAVASLTSIVNQYGLDGIDIDYESFQESPATFASAIGQLITTLKAKKVISFASIAPFDDATVQSNYQALWKQYGGAIDYVNFQFYAYDKSTTASQYVAHYNAQQANYPGGNILASFLTQPNQDTVAPATALSACKTLKSQGKLFGIFIFSADDSKNSGSFTYEKQAEALLA